MAPFSSTPQINSMTKFEQMIFEYDLTCARNSNNEMLEQFSNQGLLNTPRSKSPFESNSTEDLNSSSNNFDCLMNEVDGVNVDSFGNESGKSDEENVSPCRYNMLSNSSNENTLQQTRNNHLQNNIPVHQHSSNEITVNNGICMQSGKKQRNHLNSYGATSSLIGTYVNEKNIRFSNDFSNSVNKFQYIVMAPTSPAVKTNEDTLTYLNQGQNYELKLSRLNSSAIQSNIHQNCDINPSNLEYIPDSRRQLEDIKPMINTRENLKDILIEPPNDNLNQMVCGSENYEKIGAYHDLNEPSASGPIYLSVIRLCFWDRKLQEIEQEEIKEWEKEYQNTRMLEIDNNSNYGVIDLRFSDIFTNAAEIIWNGKSGASIFFRCNCTSTAFAPHKHGGEKGIHMRFQIDTFEVAQVNSLNSYNSSNLNNISYQANPSISPHSMSNFLPNNKFIKEDIDSEYPTNSKSYHQRYMTPPPIPDFSTGNYWKHVCSSYCRVQLFRLKGAQRKLKTDKSKVDRLNPTDMRKRYQNPSRITFLYNCQFDSLYSMMPFSRYMETSHHQTTPDNNPDQCLMMNNESSIRSSMNLNPSINSYYASNSTISSSMPMYCSNYSSQSILIEQNKHQRTNSQQISPVTSSNDLMNSSIAPIESHRSQLVMDPAPIQPSSISSMSSSSSANEESRFYLESNPTYQTLTTKPISIKEVISSEIPVMNSGMMSEISVGTGDELVYNRMKRTASITSLNNTSSYSYSSNTYGYNKNKIPRTNSIAVTGQTMYNTKFSSTCSSPPSPLSPIPNSTQMLGLTNNHTVVQQTFANNSSPNLTKQSAYIQLNEVGLNPGFNHTAVTQVPETVQLTTILQNNLLHHDRSSKYAQDWLIANKFGHLIHLFTNYTSNDILRLNKEDVISLCGCSDGIRLYNTAHNIQIKPKLSIFVKFRNHSYYSAIFLSDWKADCLIKKLISLFSSFELNHNENYSEISHNRNENKEDNEERNESLNQSLNQDQELYLETNYEFELFLKVKDILVKTTDEVLNNLQDQSRFEIDFELNPKTYSSSNSNKLLSKSKRTWAKILMTPLD